MLSGVCGEALCENVDGSFLCLCSDENQEYDPMTGQCRFRTSPGKMLCSWHDFHCMCNQWKGKVGLNADVVQLQQKNLKLCHLESVCMRRGIARMQYVISESSAV